MKKPIFGITMGDAAGIGSEIIVKTLHDSQKVYDIAIPIVFGDAEQIKRLCKICNIDAKINIINDFNNIHADKNTFNIYQVGSLPCDIPFGKVDARCGKAAYEYIAKAIDFAMKGDIEAVVTAPLNKEALHLGGCMYPGHTEIFAALTNTKDYSMMLSSPKLKVIHVSTHTSLRKACDLAKKERVLKVIELADHTMKLMGYKNPKIAVSGLNPHAGENGLFGDEEINEIIPAVEIAKSKNINVVGPIAPDTVFHRAANYGEFDIVIAMYHDQGHIPLKLLGFSIGVNITVGLPIIRTSVDHGTAFEIAGKGIADHKSLVEAIEIAATMATHKVRG